MGRPTLRVPKLVIIWLPAAHVSVSTERTSTSGNTAPQRPRRTTAASSPSGSPTADGGLTPGGAITRGDLVLLRKAIREWNIPDAARTHLPDTLVREMTQTAYSRNKISYIKTLIEIEKARVRDERERRKLQHQLQKLGLLEETVLH